MKCENVRELFYEYTESMLTGKKLLAFEKHLESCQACQRELESFQELDIRLRQGVPGYWENIQPGQGFLARLKQLDLEGFRKKSPGIADAIQALWLKYRTALVAGLSVCIVIALALTFIPNFVSPTMPSPREESEAIPKPPSQYAAEDKALQTPSPGKGEARTTAEPKVPPAPAVVPKETPAPSSEEEINLRDIAEPPEIIGYSEEQGKLAINIALAHADVQQALKGKDIRAIEVRKFTTDIEDKSWTGPAVIITLAEPGEQVSARLYVCVDLDKHHVVAIER